METAILLTAGLLNTPDAKTSHGLIRESNRFKIIAVVDQQEAGKDAGELLDGKHRSIPVLSSVEEAIKMNPQYFIVGVATLGGIFPPSMLEDIKIAIQHGISIINGLHDYLSERSDVAELALKHNAKLLDIRKPKSRKDLHFWTGDILDLKIPIVAVLGTDCALGKRTTQKLILNACKEADFKAGFVYTGQTGWLQGGKYGFIFDSTLNDFVSGEMEHAILSCAKEDKPELIIIEGQSALRNPTGPCGSEMLVSGNARHVILVHAPKRIYYEHHEPWGAIHSVESEMELIGMYGAKVIAIALNTEHCTPEEAWKFKEEYEERTGLTVILPLYEGCKAIVPLLKQLTIQP